MEEKALKEEIIKQAKEKAAAISRGIEEEEEKALAELDERMAALMEEELSAFKERLKEREQEETARARLEVKRALSLAKEEIYKKALNEAIDSFLSSKRYEGFLAKVLSEAAEQYPKEKLHVHCNKADRELVKKHLPANAELKADLNDRGLEIDVGKKGLVLNYTLETLLAEKSEALRAYFYKNVFGGK